MKKILVVDDEVNIRTLLNKYLSRNEFNVIEAKDGVHAIELCRKMHFDLILMDVMMPNMNGFDAYVEISKSKQIPCIFLTALSQDYNALKGYDSGCQDYVTKPFSLEILLRKINVILNRSNLQEELEEIVFEDLKIDLKSRLVYLKDEKIILPKKLFDLLLFLIQKQGEVVSRQEISVNVWGYDYYSEDRSLDTHIKLLRKELKDYAKYITTLRGIGYRFEKKN